ncbi:GIY-YIG nuclease family protein [Thiomicrorhabdus lithotrophica]|uniref:GIY-YIG nuclease family protein n=1 Tax=Thiomicrorhabdus lithotrophica TaxID=2949997 RepID=A0ABY8CI02_9GAMM|nr:GIY-YIG nuclease family protein [Thiomicrorhabdus lithotrophica]
MPSQNAKFWYVYLLRCADNSLYCGITTDLQKRLRQHNGELIGGAKYTKVRQPCELVYSETSENRSEASKREYAIKQLTKSTKELMIQQHEINPPGLVKQSK